MLLTLEISNYALIDHIRLDLTGGLNIITGETGAGKSIILGALGLLLGARADSKAIGHPEARSVVEATFSIAGNEQLAQIASEADLEWEGDVCILRREISPSGRSRAFVNDSPVNLATLSMIGMQLVDIHSQHQNQQLATAEFQLQIIDALADNGNLLVRYSGLYGEFREALRRYKATKAAIERDAENADFIQYQLEKLDKLDAAAGELERLEAERDQMASMADVKAVASDALTCMADGDSNAIDMVRHVRDCLEDISGMMEDGDNIGARLDNVLVELDDIADSIRKFDSEQTADPADLEYTENRIGAIEAMMRRHHVQTDTELLEIQASLRRKAMRLADSEAILSELESEAKGAHRKAVECARELSAKRLKAASEFGQRLKEAATPLGMRNLRVEIAVEHADLSATGMDRVEFRFAFNKNQAALPVGSAASGGEISRLMLCIKAIIADTVALPTIIFDEVDTGVSGDIAARMGRLMVELSRKIQVVAITHLPQIAAMGDVHYKVYKADSETSTHTHLNRLAKDERIGELALMLSGDSANDAARATAIHLLDAKNNI